MDMRVESLGSLIEAALATAADGAVYGRGQGLVDAVGELRIADGEATATVSGTFPYSVRLTWQQDEDGGVAGDCNCPHHASGAFCKHLVAVGLAVLQATKRSSALVEAEPTGWRNQPLRATWTPPSRPT
ncbi:Zinc finger SWIM-type profile [Actinomyces succiniciruminis]|uniref:Zinc finger SWIM-type profile n=2 Tax=Actinomyces succiniciruminis TaxID=1522002 RepID=A0A1L7RNR8_9ACTO|nr:Zinc finger SWIM-type profile [Actinomyces succiniciruminis]